MELQEYLGLVVNQKTDIKPLIASLTEQVLIDDDFRQLVINQLMTNDFILVYYPSFLIIEKASKSHPLLFFCYWDKFSLLLDYKNSYHRNYGMQILANLTKVDDLDKFDGIFDAYYKQLNDVKFLTRRYCILNSRNIIKNKPSLSDSIVSNIIDSIKTSNNSEKQQNLIIADFINVVSETLSLIKEKKELLDFLFLIDNQTNSLKVKKEIHKVIAKIKK
jgi:hypothetical protein